MYETTEFAVIHPYIIVLYHPMVESDISVKVFDFWE